MTAPTNEELAERLRKRAKAIRELREIATHIGPFPLDAMLIDAKLEEAAAARLSESGGEQELPSVPNTPETDAFLISSDGLPDIPSEAAVIAFARTLERQRDALAERLRRLEEGGGSKT